MEDEQWWRKWDRRPPKPMPKICGRTESPTNTLWRWPKWKTSVRNSEGEDGSSLDTLREKNYETDCRTAMTRAPGGRRWRGRLGTTWRKTAEEERERAGRRSWRKASTSSADRAGWRQSVETLFATWGEDVTCRRGVSDNSEIKGSFSLAKMECKGVNLTNENRMIRLQEHA